MIRNTKEFVNHGMSARFSPATSPSFGSEHVCILLALFNGARTLGKQLESIANQTHKDWSLIVSDDGSGDDWLDIVADFSTRHAPNRTWVQPGPRRGSAQNFLSLARSAGPMVPFVAFCDQDDAWLPCKLSRALAFLATVPDGRPGLYCGRTAVCDDDLRPLRMSPHFRRPASFANALVQNIGGGNTMVLNRAALDLVQDTADLASEVAAHDWWVYQLISGAGGLVHYDSSPTVLYRQHDANLVGANDTLSAGLHRAIQLLKGRFRAWNTQNTTALRRAGHWLTDDARRTLSTFCAAREGSLITRLAHLRRSKVYRQRTRGTVALWAASILNRL